MICVVPVPPRSKYVWLKITLAVVAILSFSIVLIEEKIWQWWQPHQQRCEQALYAKQAPIFYASDQEIESYQICADQWMLRYSGITKTPLWVAQYLTPKPEPLNSTFTLPKIATYHQAHINTAHIQDYAYQALVLNHPQSNDLQTLLNVPFYSAQQAKTWQQIDKTLLSLTQQHYQDMYVITGTNYGQSPLKKIQEIGVPKGFYKAVYIPETGVMGAYYLANQSANQGIEYLSICALEQRLNIHLFPQLSSEKKRDVYQLPLQADLDFNWPYAYWDSNSQCEVSDLKEQIATQNASATFEPTPWLARIKAQVLTWFFGLLHWLIAQLA